MLTVPSLVHVGAKARWSLLWPLVVDTMSSITRILLPARLLLVAVLSTSSQLPSVYDAESPCFLDLPSHSVKSQKNIPRLALSTLSENATPSSPAARTLVCSDVVI